jgi:hypothetical protein
VRLGVVLGDNSLLTDAYDVGKADVVPVSVIETVATAEM